VETRNGKDCGGVNEKLRRNIQKALAFVPFAAHYFCIISSNFSERVGDRFGSPSLVTFLTRQESNNRNYW
jgi:hypothetical protein